MTNNTQNRIKGIVKIVNKIDKQLAKDDTQVNMYRLRQNFVSLKQATEGLAEIVGIKEGVKDE